MEDEVEIIGMEVELNENEDNTRKSSQESIIRIAESRKNQGNDFYKKKKYKEALKYYTEAINHRGNHAPYYGNRAACYMMMGLYKQAKKDANQSILHDSQFLKGYSRLWKCCIIFGELAAAKHAIQKALELESSNIEAAKDIKIVELLENFQTEAQLSYDKKDFRKVIYIMDRALEHATQCGSMKVIKSECLAFLGRNQEAQQLANDVLQRDTTNMDALYVRSLCLYYDDNLEKAISTLQIVLRSYPDHEKAKSAFKKAKLLRQKRGMGKEAMQVGNYKDAATYYSEALQVDTNNNTINAKLHFNKALALSKLSQIEEAIGEYSEAVTLDEEYLKAYINRANLYMSTSQFQEAVKDYEKITKMDGGMYYKTTLSEAKLALKKSKRKDYYKILHINKNASDDEIKKAYRKLALVHHPDRHSGASEEVKKDHEQKFKELGEAYLVMSDSKKKDMYDNGQDLEDMNNGGGFPQDFDSTQVFQTFFGASPFSGNRFSFGTAAGPSGFSQFPSGCSFQFG